MNTESPIDNQPEVKLLAPNVRRRFLKALTELVGTLSTAKSTLVDEYAFAHRNGVKLKFLLALRDLGAILYDYSKMTGAHYTATAELANITPEQVDAKMNGIDLTRIPSNDVSFDSVVNDAIEQLPEIEQDEEHIEGVTSFIIDGNSTTGTLTTKASKVDQQSECTTAPVSPDPLPEPVINAPVFSQSDSIVLFGNDMIISTNRVNAIVESVEAETVPEPETGFYLVYTECTEAVYELSDYDKAESAAKEISDKWQKPVHILKSVARVESVRSFKITPIL